MSRSGSGDIINFRGLNVPVFVIFVFLVGLEFERNSLFVWSKNEM